MGHIVKAKEEVYKALAERLFKSPMGITVNEELMAILYRLYIESEAAVGSKFPLVPMTLDKVADITGIKQAELKKTLDDMADKGLVLDLPRQGDTYYLLAPIAIGFYEHTFMRVKGEVDLKEMAELFTKFFESPEAVQSKRSVTQLFKTMVYENLIPLAIKTEVLDYERASEFIRQSGGGSINVCSCRHHASHLGQTCQIRDVPMETCMSLGEWGQWIARRGFGRAATVDELLRLLDQTEKLGLVHLCDNVLNKPAYICNCCSCCCGVLSVARKYGKSSAHPSNFIPTLDDDNCEGCGVCADSCPVKAITMSNTGRRVEIPQVDEQKCLGCGLCAAACPNGERTMTRRTVLHVPPANKTEQLMRIAKEKGKDIKLGSNDFLLL